MAHLPIKERIRYRSALARMVTWQRSVEASLQQGKPIDAAILPHVEKLTGTDDPESAFMALEEMHQRFEAEYLTKLCEASYDDFSAFSEFMNPEEPPARHHLFLCDNLMAMSRGEIIRLMISMPPGHAKSTYSSHRFPAWWLGRNPRRRFIQAGHTQKFCEDQLSKPVREIVRSEKFKLVFPDVGITRDSNAAGFWALTTGGSYATKGVGQGIAGYRAHCAGVDDPFASREDAESEIVRKKVWDWFSADFTTRLLPRSPMYIVATRWHEDDLCGRVEELHKQRKGYPWTIINLPAVAGPNDPLGRAEGEALWPELFDLEYLLALKASIPARDWNSLYQGSPTNEGGGMVKGEIARYDELPRNLPGELPIVRRLTISVDSANKAQERHDYTVVTVWIETTDRRHYLVDVKRTKVEFDDLISLIENTTRAWQNEFPGVSTAILVEDRGSGTQYIQQRRGLAPAIIIPIEITNLSKEFRFDGVSPMFGLGEVVLPNRALWLAEYEKEVFEYAGEGSTAYDDQVDSTSQYLAWARNKRSGGTKKLKGAAHAGAQQGTRVESEDAPKAAQMGTPGEVNELVAAARAAAAEAAKVVN